MTIDLHALANAPGYGIAFRTLKKAGLIGEDPTAPLWVVHLYGMQPVAASIEVRARTAAEAEEIANERAEDGRLVQWEPIDNVGDIVSDRATPAEPD
jgi:hypothetical protein